MPATQDRYVFPELFCSSSQHWTMSPLCLSTPLISFIDIVGLVAKLSLWDSQSLALALMLGCDSDTSRLEGH